MADKLDVQVTGRSKYEVAHLMAQNVLNVNQTSLKDKVAYFNTVAEAVDALSGIRLKTAQG